MAEAKITPIPNLTPEEIERFHKFIDKRGPDECWPWTGAFARKGYGNFCIRQRIYRANRIALFLKTGIDPGPSLSLHTCDNPPCCNGEHLFAGTKADNMRDMYQKGRHRRTPKIMRGEENPHAALTEIQVRDILRRYSKGDVSRSSLAAEYSVSPGAIKGVVLRRNWTHVSID